jgi:aminoglycoside phosphotransferase (APT) family kinase protein
VTTLLEDNDHPTAERRARLRERYPTDPTFQRAIDLKLDRRSSGPWRGITRDELVSAVRRMVRDECGPAATVHDARWLTGGASKIQLAFRLSVPGQGPRSLLVRMDPAETLNATIKTVEHDLIRAIGGAIAVPEVLWVDQETRYFPEPALVCSMSPGVTKPSASQTGQVTGLGTDFGPALRALLAPQFVDNIATLHALPGGDLGTSVLTVPRIGTTENALWRLNFERQLWDVDRSEECPLMDLAAQWMEDNLPVLDRVSVVHGDYRSGNFLFDEGTALITGTLDWESGHLGDRHADLAYTTQSLYGHLAEDGHTFLVGGLMPREQFFARYEESSGLTVDPETLRWYAVLASYSAVVKTLATSMRVARLGRSHQDPLLARLEGTVPTLLAQLLRQLKEVW